MKKAKVKDHSKKATGHHKIRGPVKNRKKSVAPKSINQNTMTPADSPNRADADLGNLLSN